MSKENFLARYGSIDHVRHLLGNSDSSIFEYDISTRKDLPEDIEERLANSKSEGTRANIAGATSNVKHLDKLSTDSSYIVRNNIPWNLNANSQHLDNVRRNNSFDSHRNHINHLIAYHPNASKEQLENIKNSAATTYPVKKHAEKRLENGDHK